MTYPYIQLNRSIATPLYYQLEVCVEKAIASGQLKPNEKLPTEEELCQYFNISRPVVRQAYADLINKGLIARHKGKGTFVKEPEVRGTFFKELTNFSSEMARLGMVPHTKLLKQEVAIYDEALWDHMQLDANDQVYHIRRLRFGNDLPIVVVDTYIPMKYFVGIETFNFEKESLYDVYENRYHETVVRAIRTFEACVIDNKDAELLEVKRHSAVHKVITSAYDAADQLIEYSIALYPGERNVFDVEIRKS